MSKGCSMSSQDQVSVEERDARSQVGYRSLYLLTGGAIKTPPLPVMQETQVIGTAAIYSLPPRILLPTTMLLVEGNGVVR
jgi:hypothetical protein